LSNQDLNDYLIFFRNWLVLVIKKTPTLGELKKISPFNNLGNSHNKQKIKLQSERKKHGEQRDNVNKLNTSEKNLFVHETQKSSHFNQEYASE